MLKKLVDYSYSFQVKNSVIHSANFTSFLDGLFDIPIEVLTFARNDVKTGSRTAINQKNTDMLCKT